MKKLIIAMLAASGAAVVYAQAETGEREGHGGEFRAEMRALIDGDGMSVTDLAGLMQERSQARFEALDGDDDGIVTREEFLAGAEERAKTRFERMGPNEDGVVTRTGRKGWSHHHWRGERAAENAEQRTERLSERATREFSRLDADGDGMISPEEFEAGMQARGERFAERREQRKERHGGMRGEMGEEMRAMHREMRALMRDGLTLERFTELTGTHAAARFDALDADENGELTLEEFTANVAERAERVFARMDRNDDGVVTADDRRGGKHRGPRE